MNQTERPLSGGASTYLALLGLALPTDENVFDATNRLFPRPRDPDDVKLTVREYYLIFPHLQPFADSTRLVPVERSDSLYRTPQYLILSQGPADQVHLPAPVQLVRRRATAPRSISMHCRFATGASRSRLAGGCWRRESTIPSTTASGGSRS